MTVTDDIKAKLDIVAYISQTVPLKKAGKHYKACCPFHNERTPSFTVDAERQTWHCFGCGQYGDLFAFAMKRHGWTFGEALDELGRLAGVEVKRADPVQAAQTERLWGLLNTVADSYHRILKGFEGAQAARDHLAARGIGETIIDSWRLGYAPPRGTADHLRKLGYSDADLLAVGLLARRDDGSLYEVFRHRLLIPICDARGRVIAFGGRALGSDEPKYLNSPQTALFDKHKTLFALDRARGQDTIVIVEGYFDVLAAHQAGFTNVVAPMGTALTEAQLGLLKRARTLVLALDGDEAGKKSTRRALELLVRQPADMRVAQMPAGQDPDEVIRAAPDAWRALIDGGVSAADYIIADTVRSLPPGATIAERIRAARTVLPLLMAVEDDLFRQSHVQNLALALGLPERELMAQARPSAPEPMPIVLEPPRADSPELYCWRAYVHDDRFYVEAARALSELEFEPPDEHDFVRYPLLMRLYLEASVQFDQDTGAYVRAQLDPALLPLLDGDPPRADVVMYHALKLRLERLTHDNDARIALGESLSLEVLTAKARLQAKLITLTRALL